MAIDNMFDQDYNEDEEEKIYYPIVADPCDVEHSTEIDPNVLDDYEYSRKNMRQIIDTGILALEPIAKMANECESPRAMEVLSNHLKLMIDSNESLMKMHLDMRKTMNKGKEKDEEESPAVTNNIVFSGSTEDLLESIEGKVVKK